MACVAFSLILLFFALWFLKHTTSKADPLNLEKNYVFKNNDNDNENEFGNENN